MPGPKLSPANAILATISPLLALTVTLSGPGCSSKSANQPPPQQPLANLGPDEPEPPPAAPEKAYTAADACRGMLALDDWQTCGLLSEEADQDKCVATMDDLATRTPRARRSSHADMYRCVVENGDTCAAQKACTERWAASRYAGCGRREDPFSPVRPDPDAITPSGRLAELNSSLGDPVEVCGVRGQREFLMLSQCADGSSPYASSGQIASSREGSFGSGGRCGSIIDMYRVKCPEKTYEVYMDMYVCDEGESIF